jgi:hypothetical protein
MSPGTNDVRSPRVLVVAATALAWAAWGGPLHAAPISFKVPISGVQQVPLVETQGYGVADLTYDPGTRLVTWTVIYNGLSGPVTAAQFHGPAQPSKNAPGLVSLAKQGRRVVHQHQHPSSSGRRNPGPSPDAASRTPTRPAPLIAGGGDAHSCAWPASRTTTSYLNGRSVL